MLDWNDLRYLWTIARAGSLAAAARELKVEHTTVGRRLSALESALGTKLFVRGPSGLVATPPCRDALAKLDAIAAVLEGRGITVLPCLPYMVRVARVRTVIDFIDELVARDRAQFT